MTALSAATAEVFERYSKLIKEQQASGMADPLAEDRYLSLTNLLWMCDQAVAEHDSLPIDKISRWLGCVQGCLASRGLISIEAERDFTRTLFHGAYAQDGIEIPGRRERAIEP